MQDFVETDHKALAWLISNTPATDRLAMQMDIYICPAAIGCHACCIRSIKFFLDESPKLRWADSNGSLDPRIIHRGARVSFNVVCRACSKEFSTIAGKLTADTPAVCSCCSDKAVCDVGLVNCAGQRASLASRRGRSCLTTRPGGAGGGFGPGIGMSTSSPGSMT